MPETTAGDVFRVYVLPKGTNTPWVRIHLYPYGIKHGKPNEVGGVDPTKDRAAVARKIGEEIIRNSKVLRKWFGEK